jgi:hypothetical protein
MSIDLLALIRILSRGITGVLKVSNAQVCYAQQPQLPNSPLIAL